MILIDMGQTRSRCERFPQTQLLCHGWVDLGSFGAGPSPVLQPCQCVGVVLAPADASRLIAGPILVSNGRWLSSAMPAALHERPALPGLGHGEGEGLEGADTSQTPDARRHDARETWHPALLCLSSEPPAEMCSRLRFSGRAPAFTTAASIPAAICGFRSSTGSCVPASTALLTSPLSPSSATPSFPFSSWHCVPPVAVLARRAPATGARHRSTPRQQARSAPTLWAIAGARNAKKGRTRPR